MSEDYDSSYEESEVDEQMDAILENYNINFHPEFRLKFKRRLETLSVSAAYCKPWDTDPRWRFTVKPLGKRHPAGRYMSKFTFTPALSFAAVHSHKLRLGILRLQLVAGFNWDKMRPLIDYRLWTKWDDGPSFKRREKFNIADTGLLRIKWNMDLRFPDMEGHIGRDDPRMKKVAVDVGHLRFDVSQIDWVIAVDDVQSKDEDSGQGGQRLGNMVTWMKSS